MRLTAIYSSTLGIFPWKFLFQDRKFYQKLYRYYSIFILTWYIGFVVTAYIELFVLLSGETIKMEEVCTNMCLTLVFTCAGLRACVMRYGNRLDDTIQSIIDTERNTNLLDDENVREYENKYISVMRTFTHCYAASVIIPDAQRSVFVAITSPQITEVGNVTVSYKPHIMSSWFPFDKQEHYWPAYWFQVFDGAMGASFVAFVDIFMFNLISYPVGQLTKLQHLIRNLKTYQDKAWQAGVQQADLSVLNDLVRRHQKIISYIDVYNNYMGTFAIFEFIQSSVQIASVLAQTSPDNLTLEEASFIVCFFISMTIRMFLYYFSANQVIVESRKVAISVWESNWYEQRPEIQKSLLLMMIRAQKPLCYRIGGFGIMSVESIIAIMKGTYTYITIIYRGY